MFVFQEQIEKKKTQFSDGEDADDDDDETDETDDECESDASSMITSNSNSRLVKRKIFLSVTIEFYKICLHSIQVMVLDFYQDSGCFSY